MSSHVHDATYSKIIRADDYNRLMTQEHLYIAEADRTIQTIVDRYSMSFSHPAELLEIGCGPLRLTPLLTSISHVRVTALDYDEGWMPEARARIDQEKLPLNLVCANIETYKHPLPIDIAVSQGTHHHLQKGETTQHYLTNVREQLSSRGIFVISDEMIPYYTNEQERQLRLCLWYAHIIDHAKKHGYQELAQAETETLLDDLFEGSGIVANKSKEQRELLRTYLPRIADLTQMGKVKESEAVAAELVSGLWRRQKAEQPNDIPLSRGDYKVCFSVFEQEIRTAGFRIRENQTLGPIKTIGGFGIYTLEKT